jgi:hypothetical protein
MRCPRVYPPPMNQPDLPVQARTERPKSPRRVLMMSHIGHQRTPRSGFQIQFGETLSIGRTIAF